MDGALKEFEARIKGLEVYELFILAAIGLALALFGYRIKKFAFFILWFLIGFNLIIIISPNIYSMVPQIAENELWQNLLPIGGGLLLALLGFSIEKFCVSGICFALTILLGTQYFGTEIQTLAILAIVGIVVGGAAVMLMKPATIIATAVAGGYALTLAILTWVPDIDYAVFYWPLIIGIGAVGSIFQFLTTKRVS